MADIYNDTATTTVKHGVTHGSLGWCFMRNKSTNSVNMKFKKTDNSAEQSLAPGQYSVWQTSANLNNISFWTTSGSAAVKYGTAATQAEAQDEGGGDF